MYNINTSTTVLFPEDIINIKSTNKNNTKNTRSSLFLITLSLCKLNEEQAAKVIIALDATNNNPPQTHFSFHSMNPPRKISMTLYIILFFNSLFLLRLYVF